MTYQTIEQANIKITDLSIKAISPSVTLENEKDINAFVSIQENNDKEGQTVAVIVPIYDDFSNLRALNLNPDNPEESGLSYLQAIDLFDKTAKGKLYFCYDGIENIPMEFNEDSAKNENTIKVQGSLKADSFYLFYELLAVPKHPLPFTYYLLNFHYEQSNTEDQKNSVLMKTPVVNFHTCKFSPELKRGTVTTPQSPIS